MKLRRFSKSVATLMTAMMLSSSVPVTAFAENGVEDAKLTETAEEEATEDLVVEDVAEEVAEDLVVEDVVEDATDNALLDETDEIFEEDVDESDIAVLKPIDVAKHFGDVIPYYLYGGMDMGVGSDNEYFTQTGDPIWWPSEDYKAYYKTYGIGYFMEKKYNTKPQVISNNGEMALGNLKARIEEKDGYYYLHLTGVAEYSVNVWRSSPAGNGGPSNDKWAFQSENQYWADLAGVKSSVQFGQYINSQGELVKIEHQGDFLKDGNREYAGNPCYDGPNGVVPIKWKVNGKYEEDLLVGSPCEKKGAACSYGIHYTYPSRMVVHNCNYDYSGKYVHEELKLRTPGDCYSANLKLSDEAYYLEFDQKYDLGINYGTKDYEEKVDKLVITEIMGVPVRMYVYPDSYELFKPNLIEKMGIVDKTVSGDTTSYSILLETNAPMGGTYTFEISCGNKIYKKKVQLSEGKKTQNITLDVPTGSTSAMYINSIYIGDEYSKTTNGINGKELAYIDSIHRDIPDLRFNINCAKGITKIKTKEDGKISEKNSIQFDYKVNQIGKYKFLFGYMDSEGEGTIPVEMELQKTSGTAAITFSRDMTELMSDLRQLRLVNVTSPEGYTISYKNSQIIYRNDELLQADAPKKFDVAVSVTDVSKSFGLSIAVDIDYASPKTYENCKLVLETGINGTTKFENIPINFIEGYHKKRYNTFSGDTTNNSWQFDSNTDYVKLLYIEGPEGKLWSFDDIDITTGVDSQYTVTNSEYLYCNHIFDSNGCDADCNECGAIRLELPHDFSKDCTSCSKCGEVRKAHPNACDTDTVCPDCGKVLVVGWMEDKNGKLHYVLDDGTYLKKEWAYYGDKLCYFDVNGDIVRNQWIPDNGCYYYVNDSGQMLTGWGKVSGKSYYFGKDGARVIGFVTIDGKTYEFSNEGVLKQQIMYTGWTEDDDGDWYYISKDGTVLKNGWAKFDGEWCYTDKNGRMVTDSWIYDNDKWYYLSGSGAMLTGWTKIAGEQYYLGTDGAKAIGFVTIDNKTYEFSRDGVLKRQIQVTGWVDDDDGEWYYIADDGTVLKNGWAKFDDDWCYTGKDGRMVTDKWIQYKNNWYYLGVSGKMLTGWGKLGGVQYYFGENGAMATGIVTIDGKTYQFASNGVLVKEIVQSEAGNQQSSDKKNGLIEEAGKTYYYVNDVKQLGWKKVDNAWYNFGTNGVMAKNKWVADGKDWFYCGADGKMVTKKWISYKNDWYYFGADGAMVTDKWVSYQNNWYYFNASGIMVTSKWVQYKNDWYYVDADGIMVTGKQVINGKTYNFNSLGVWISN